jgi:ATP-dependent exoDNAse (exonuclease V) beta subunit
MAEGSLENGYVYETNARILTNQNASATEDLSLSESLSPSWLHEEFSQKIIPTQLKQDISLSAKRGIEIHKLFELTSGMNISQAIEFLNDALNNIVPYCNLSQKDQQKILKVLSVSEMDMFFSKQAFSEVELTDGNQLMRLDRLLVNDKEVLILDIKTSENPPQTPEQVDDDICEQMNSYKQLLQKKYPKHNVRTFLLWTETPSLMEILKN